MFQGTSFHVIIGTIALLSGAAALIFKKGSRPHRMSGNLYFVSMVALCLTGLYLAFIKQNIPSSTAIATSFLGILTLYLVVTSWITVKRPEGETGAAEIGALIYILGTAVYALTFGLNAAHADLGHSGGIPAAPPVIFYVLAGIAVVLAAFDLRIIRRGGISGAARIIRHLWRMCFAMLIATASVFIGQDVVFPDFLRDTGLLNVPVLLVLIITVFWLIRVRFTNWYGKT